MNHIELGKFGEDLASKHLISKGFELLHRNYRWGKLEIDIVCLHHGKLIIVEVKTRNSFALGKPFLAVTLVKQRQIIKVANQYIVEHQRTEEIRFDVVSIVHNSKQQEIEHIVDAFYPVV